MRSSPHLLRAVVDCLHRCVVAVAGLFLGILHLIEYLRYVTALELRFIDYLLEQTLVRFNVGVK